MIRSFQRIRRWMLVAPAVLFLSTAARASTNLVFRVDVSWLASFQTDYGSLLDAKITDADLINLALGHTPPLAVKLFIAPRGSVSRPPTAEVLALAVNCGRNAVRLIVFDTSTSSNLATVATLGYVDSVTGEALRSGGGIGEIKSEHVTQELLEGSFEPVGSASNNVLGGSLTLRLANNCNTNHPLTQANGAALGSVHVVINGQDLPGMIKRGTFSTKGPVLGTLVED